MPIVDFYTPIQHVHGTLAPSSPYYIRVVNGRNIMQRRPHFTNPPSEKQLAARRLFAQKYAGSHRSVPSKPDE